MYDYLDFPSWRDIAVAEYVLSALFIWFGAATGSSKKEFCVFSFSFLFFVLFVLLLMNCITVFPLVLASHFPKITEFPFLP